MSNGSDRDWPYLSPTRPGWEWVGGSREEIRRILSPRRPDNQPKGDPNRVVLETLERLARLAGVLQDEILALVTEAHFRGASWSEIARRMGKSKQCVHERYQRRMYAHTTHEALRRDLAQAWRQARAIQLQGGENDEVAMLLEFLRERSSKT